MDINKDTVAYLCELSKLQLNDDSAEQLVSHLSEVLNYMKEIDKIDTYDVEPLSHVFPIVNVMREDLVKDSFDSSLILKNAPCRNEEYFIVPRSVEQEGQ